MPLSELDLDWAVPSAIPPPVVRFVAEADERYDRFWEAGLRRRYPRYVPSEPAQVYAALKRITDLKLPLGRVFCEWGSGFGVATGLASLLGYVAHGVEVEARLVDNARSLLADSGIDACIIHGSYIPDGCGSYAAWGGDQLIAEPTAADRGFSPRYEGMGYDLDEIDLFFVYPWPGEQEMMLDLFERFAADGALLLAYFGEGDLCLYQRIPEDAGEEDEEDF